MIVKSNIVADQLTKNKRIYPKDVLIEALDEYNSKPTKFGEIGTSDSIYINCENIGIQIKEAKLENDEVVADIDLLNVPNKESLKILIDNDELILKLRGIGHVNEQGVVHDFKIISFDLDSKEK
jgi:uncharacterized protein YacL (UPF0231 family)